jgi:hypothetical protein
MVGVGERKKGGGSLIKKREKRLLPFNYKMSRR